MIKFRIYRSFKEARFAWLIPLVFFQVYLAAVALLFYVGPWPWPIDNEWQLASFLAAAQVFIAIGYLLSWRFVAAKIRTVSIQDKAEAVSRGVRFAKICFVLTLVMAVPTSLSRTGQPIPDVLGGITNAGYAYNDAFAIKAEGNPYVVVEYLRIILSVYMTGALPLLVVYWNMFSIKWRVIGVMAIAASIAVFLATGVNKGIADAICLTPFFYFLSLRIFARKGIAGRVVLGLGLLAALVGFLAFFSAGQAQREGGVGEFGVYNGGDRIIWAESQNMDWLLSREARIAYESVVRYTTAGYYALALSFDIEHDSTFGIGNSMFLASNFDSAFETDYFTEASLPAELERRVGLGHFTTWHSIFLWFGSDVGLYGSLLVIGGFAFLFGLSWGYSIFRSDQWSLIMTANMLIMFFYVPANNQVFQSGEGAVGFLVVAIAMWRYARPGMLRVRKAASRLEPHGTST